MGGCLRAMRVMLRGVLRGVLRGAAVVCYLSPRGAAWSYMILHGVRGDGMVGWWMMDVET